MHIQVASVVPDEDASEPCFEPEALKWMDELQRLADDGNVEEITRHGVVYIRKAG